MLNAASHKVERRDYYASPDENEERGVPKSARPEKKQKKVTIVGNQ